MTHLFDPDHLRASLAPLQQRATLSEPQRQYQAFYGLDFPNLPVAVDTWLGGFDIDGFALAGQVWIPEKPVATLFVLHGFYDHMGLYRHLIRWALARRFAVIACDLPGHGLSSGPRAVIDDFAHYQRTLNALFEQARQLDLPRPWHLAGQSTGGAIVIDHLLSEGDSSPVDGHVVLFAPLVRPTGWNWSKLSYRFLSPFVSGIARRFSENTNDPAFMPFLQQDPLQPLRLPTVWVGALARWIPRIEAAPPHQRELLVIQGEADMTVDWSHNLTVLQSKFGEPRLLRLPAARHHLVNEIPELRRQYFEFLEREL